MNQDTNNGVLVDDQTVTNTSQGQENINNNSGNDQGHVLSQEEIEKLKSDNESFRREMTQNRQELAEMKRAASAMAGVKLDNPTDQEAANAAQRLQQQGLADKTYVNTLVGGVLIKFKADEYAKTISSNATDKRLEISGDELMKVMQDHNLFNDPEAAYRIARGPIKEEILTQELLKVNKDFDQKKKDVGTAVGSIDNTMETGADIKEEDFTLDNSADNVLKEFEAAGI